MQIIIAIILASALAIVIFKWKLFKKNYWNSSIFCGLFVLKLCFGISFYLVYTKYYSDSQTSDMHKYYHDARKIFELTKENPLSYLSILTGLEMNTNEDQITQQLSFWYQEESASVINDSRMIIRFNLLLFPLSNGNIYIHLVLMVFLSFIGLYLFYLSFEKYFKGREILLLISCFGIPSVMFWSSGIMKEGLLMFFFGIVIFSLFGIEKKTFLRALLFIFSMLGMYYTKFYVALSLIPSLLFLLFGFFMQKKTPLKLLTITIIMVIFGAFSFNQILNNVPLQKLSKKQNDFINLSIGGVYMVNTNLPFDTIFTLKQRSLRSVTHIIEGNTAQLKSGTTYHHWQNPGYADTIVANKNNSIYKIVKVLEPTGSAITMNRLMPNYWNVLVLFPEAFVNVCFRPFFFDIENLFSLLACAENIAIIVLFMMLFYWYKKPEIAIQKIIIFSLLFVFTLYTLVGLTTPVLGAAVRYKVPALPFLLISLFLFSDQTKLSKFISVIKKR